MSTQSWDSGGRLGPYTTNDYFRLIDIQRALAEQRELVKRWQDSRMIYELLSEARAIRLHGKRVRF